MFCQGTSSRETPWRIVAPERPTKLAFPKMSDGESCAAAWVVSRDPVRVTLQNGEDVRLVRTLHDVDAGEVWTQIQLKDETQLAPVDEVRLAWWVLVSSAAPTHVRAVADVVQHVWALPQVELSKNALAASAADKMVLVVNHDLGMTKGKVAAQVGHAVAAVAEEMLDKRPELWAAYKAQGQAKIVLKTSSATSIYDVAAMPGAHAVIDAGLTQIAPGSMTVVGFPPAKNVCPELAKLKLL